MKILLAYTLDTIRRNKRTSLSIMTAILLASSLLSTLCTALYTQWKWQITLEEERSGNWHGELGGYLSSADLALADHHLKVDKTMVKGPYTCVKLPDQSALPYLLLQNADANYWTEMGYENLLLNGRLPEKPGEIVVAKSFFDRNPQYKIGDTLTLPAGSRMVEEQVLTVETIREGETFASTGSITVTLTGSLDLSTATTTPGYYSMGYLDRSAFKDTDDLVIYVKMKEIRDTYTVMPELASILNLPKDEYGNYDNHFRYHTNLLFLNGVFAPDQTWNLKNYLSPLMYAAFLILASFSFVLIIKSAFSLSANARIKQLGMFRSIGATPGQIRTSILFEGLILSVIPFLLSIGVGFGFTSFIYQLYTNRLGSLLFYPVTVVFSWPVMVFSSAISLLTVLISASIPARKAAKMSPMEAIRTKPFPGNTLQKKFRFFLYRPFRFQGELAARSHAANRHAFRASVTALTLCFMLVSSLFCFLVINNLQIEQNRSAMHFNINGRFSMLNEPDPAMIADFLALPDTEETMYYSYAKASYWTTGKESSDEFMQTGGLAALDSSRYQILKQNDMYRVGVRLYGLDPSTFASYCKSIGEDPDSYYNQKQPKAIAASLAPRYPDTRDREKAKQNYKMLEFVKGQTLILDEKRSNYQETNYQYPIRIGAYTTQTPVLDDFIDDYQIQLYVPIDVFYSIISQYQDPNAQSAHRLLVNLSTTPGNDLAVTSALRTLSKEYLSEDDTSIYSCAEEQRDSEIANQAMMAVVHCIAILLGLIGITNVLTTVSSSLGHRQREFAMLRSVGMDPSGINRLLLLEGLRMALTPVLIGIPLLMLLCITLLQFTEMSGISFLSNFPISNILIVSLIIIGTVLLTYWLASRKIRTDNIMDSLREELF